MSLSTKLIQAIRKNKASVTSDPDGVTATLQIAARLVTTGWTQGRRHELGDDGVHSYDIYGALDEAVTMAAPKDIARTWWAAHRVLNAGLPDGFDNLILFNDDDDQTAAKVNEFILDAGKRHGTVALAQAKEIKV